ncbi:MAG: formate C-acetyltransferase/glycerol dehydratase family glycyl radical enzyme [Streptococcaceae bacterium]|jgi:formate C-acetyltransferase|nr:formate C-acetyltransferase/glycerol dehydratase family glycyl radical enzyme [Streptococcaceae bacterium]MCH4176353.1 formate C-acetyltransferase/glycerol dehydratase family glycyl radical enzyme [Streptococcaceae bacterium]
MTNRVLKLKEKQNATMPSFSAERARLSTEAYEACESEDNIIQKAKMLEHILKNMTIFIQDGELIVGNHTNRPRCAPVFPEYSAEWILNSLNDFENRKTDPLQITPEDKLELKKILTKWQGKSFQDFSDKVLPKETLQAENSGVLTIGNRDCATGHIIPNYQKIIKIGLKGLKKEIKETMEKYGDDATRQQLNFWESALISIDASIKFANRYADLAEKKAAQSSDIQRKNELINIAATCRNVPENPAKNFQEGLQMVWFLHLIMSIESNGHGISFGRFDQYLNALVEKDIASGTNTQDEIVELIACFFIKATDIIKIRDDFYSESFAGYPVWQNLIIGGQTEDGKDATNLLSHLVLRANDLVQTSQPTVSVRYHDNLSPELFDYSVDMIQRGLSTPAFFNDKLVIPIMLKKGVTLAEARNWALMGCVEPVSQGNTDGRPTVGYINSLKCLEFALNNGLDPLTNQQIGLKTGEFHSLKELEIAVEQQMDYFIEMMVLGHNEIGKLHQKYHELPFASIMLDGSIESGKSIQDGGAKYSESGTFICGIGNTSDAIAAIDTLVFKNQLITLTDLKDALTNDFQNNEKLRLTLLNKAPKYGNDIDYVDKIGSRIIKHYTETLSNYKDSRGGQFSLTVESQSMNVSQGKCVGASADGRHAYSPLNDNCSPVMGRDVNGPTATVMSVAKLDQINAEDGCLFNLRFDPRSISGSKGKSVISGVIKTYFDHFGEHIQINVVDDKTLRKAQEKPEDYRNLLVRVAGYLAYFTELDKEVQDNIISRTAHVV